jgi:hypothetical protein
MNLQRTKRALFLEGKGLKIQKALIHSLKLPKPATASVLTINSKTYLIK